MERNSSLEFSLYSKLYNILNPKKHMVGYIFDYDAGSATKVEIGNNFSFVYSSTITINEWVDFARKNICSEYLKDVQVKFHYAANNALNLEVIEFPVYKLYKRSKSKDHFWLRTVGLKIKSGDKNCLYTLSTDCTSEMKQSEKKFRQTSTMKFLEQFLFATTESSYCKIIKVDLETFDVFEIKYSGKNLICIPQKLKWTEYIEEISRTVDKEDLPRFIRYTDVSVLKTASAGEKLKFNFRGTMTSIDGSSRWYFSFLRFFDDSAFMFFIDETDEILARKKIANLPDAERFRKSITSDAILMYEFNLSKNLLIGTPIQKIDNREVNLRESYKLPENCSYTEFIDNLVWEMKGKEKERFLEKMDTLYLTDCFIRGEYEIWFETSRLGFDGDPFWTRTTVLLTQDSQTNDIFGLAYVKNITNRYSSEEEKHYQLEIINGLTNEFTNVFRVNLLTSKIRIVRLNDKIGALVNDYNGVERYEDAMDFYISVSVYEDDRDMMHAAFSRENILKQLSKRDSFYANFRTYINNQMSFMKLMVVRIGDPGEYDNVLLAFSNVDNEVEHDMRQKKILQDALHQAESASRAKSQFLSSMSHDIRTPMNAIMGFTSIAMNHLNEPEQMKNYLEKIRSSSSHLLGLINDVLDMSRIECGKMKVQNTVCSMDKIIDDVCNVVQNQASMKKQSFIVEKKGEVSRQVHCDPLRLNQVLINILGNSVKYTKEEGMIKFTITEVPAAVEGFSSYQFRIKDNGIGMSKKFQEHLFESFEREESEETYKIQGTGLGLAITKSLIDLMDGSVFVNSTLGVGTEFLICFDFENAEEEKNKTLDAKELVEVNHDKFTGKRILLVEDNELNRDIARELLKNCGFVIEEEENGKLGVERLKAVDADYYSLVLMDVQMPVMDGYEATRTIRGLSDKRKAAIPVVAMTANAFEEDRHNALKAGMDSYVAKPFDMADLLRVISQMLEKKR